MANSAIFISSGKIYLSLVVYLREIGQFSSVLSVLFSTGESPVCLMYQVGVLTKQ